MRLKARVAEPAALVAEKTPEKVPACCGVPASPPSALSVRPGGNAPLLTAMTGTGKPALVVSEVEKDSSRVSVRLSGALSVNTGACATVSANALVAVPKALVAVKVPLNTPVASARPVSRPLVASVKPAGN